MDFLKIIEKTVPKAVSIVLQESLKLLPGGSLIVAGSEFLGMVVESGVEEVLSRSLTHREEFRISISAAQIVSKISKRLSDNENIRSDRAFFEDDGFFQSNAKELLEGVLISCKREHEEKKIVYLSNIFVNIIFENEIWVQEANQIIKVADSLTYRQFIFLRIFYNQGYGELNLREEQLTSGEYWEISYSLEIIELIQMGLLSQLNTEDYAYDGEKMDHDALYGIAIEEGYTEPQSWSNVIPQAIVIRSFGIKIYELLGLDQIPQDEVNQVLEILK